MLQLSNRSLVQAHAFFKPEQNTLQWQSFAVTRSMLLDNGNFNRGRDRIQTPARTRFFHNTAMAGFSLVTKSMLQKMATQIKAVRGSCKMLKDLTNVKKK